MNIQDDDKALRELEALIRDTPLDEPDPEPAPVLYRAEDAADRALRYLAGVDTANASELIFLRDYLLTLFPLDMKTEVRIEGQGEGGASSSTVWRMDQDERLERYQHRQFGRDALFCVIGGIFTVGGFALGGAFFW